MEASIGSVPVVQYWESHVACRTTAVNIDINNERWHTSSHCKYSAEIIIIFLNLFYSARADEDALALAFLARVWIIAAVFIIIDGSWIRYQLVGWCNRRAISIVVIFSFDSTWIHRISASDGQQPRATRSNIGLMGRPRESESTIPVFSHCFLFE